MDNEPKTYQQAILPLWWIEIKHWFGWTDWLKTIIKTGLQLFAILLLFLGGGSLENFTETVIVKTIEYGLTIFFIEIILFITYTRASNKLYLQQKQEREKLQAKVKSLQKTQDKKETLRNYDEIEISFQPLAMTIAERREERNAPSPIEERRLPYIIKNLGDVVIKECRIRMTHLIWFEGINNGNPTGNAPLEDSSFKWKNLDQERIDLSVGSSEFFILAKITDFNFPPIFHFVTFSNETMEPGKKIPRTLHGTWSVGIQVEGKVEKGNIKTDLIPIPYNITFEFDSYSLLPLEIVKIDR